MKICHIFSFFFNFRLLFLTLAAFFCFLGGLSSQTVDKVSLKKEQKSLKGKISFINQLLESNRKTTRNSLQEYQDLGVKIKMQSSLIRSISTEINYMSDGIKKMEKNVEYLRRDIKQLKENYARIIVQSYKTRSRVDQVMFLFSSENFYQLYKRLEYMKRYAEHRREQALAIEERGQELLEKVDMLKQKRLERLRLVGQEKSERESIKKEQYRKKQLLKSLSYKYKKLLNDKNKHEKRSKIIAKSLASIIQKEGIRVRSNTKENMNITSRFLANKGKLPWPVNSGVIVRKFGKQLYPGMKIYTENNGIYIALKPGDVVKAVFDAQVVRIFRVPGGTLAVVLRHGDYYTFYGNLKNSYVTEGQKVHKYQKLGVIYTNRIDGRTTLDFQVWYKQAKKNPEYWIARI